MTSHGRCAVRGRYLYNNQIRGPLPPTLGNLKQLQILYDGRASELCLFRVFLEFLVLLCLVSACAFRSMQQLVCDSADGARCAARSLHTNQLSGTIPDTFGDMPQLIELYGSVASAVAWVYCEARR